jgi:MFS transporter, putative metabolite:H+ symporter
MGETPRSISGIMTIVAGYHYDATLLGVSAFWLLLAVTFYYADGGFAIVGPLRRRCGPHISEHRA